MNTRSAVQATSTFYQSSPGIRAFRLGLAAAERMWPALAVRMATRLFLTPLPPKWLHRRGSWHKDWRAESWPFEDAGVTVYSPAVAPHAPVVLLVHGWGGHAGQMLPLAESIAAQGLRPVLLEMPGHGSSRGSTSTLPQFEPRAVGSRIRVPTLVVHDRGDSINRFPDGQAYAHAIREARLSATEGLGHRKILKDAQVIGEVAIFVA